MVTQDRTIRNLINLSLLSNINISYIEILYREYLSNYKNFDTKWQKIFKDISSSDFLTQYRKQNQNNKTIASKDELYLESSDLKIERYIYELVNDYRSYGHLYANLNPLDSKRNLSNSSLYLSNLSKKNTYHSFTVDKCSEVDKLISILDKSYCGYIGVEYMHLLKKEEKLWIQDRVESNAGNFKFNKDEKINILETLIAAEEFEHCLNAKFPGSKRFSLEGGEALITILNDIIQYSGAIGVHEIILGMAHRGRLNVLVNILGKKPQDLFSEFSSKLELNNDYSKFEDVKYHAGFSSKVKTSHGVIKLMLLPNPSHLEIIGPVIMGFTRARQDEYISKNQILAVNIHGDASITGQGVVQETLNMSLIHGYRIGGTIHIIINNQIGFTTPSEKSRSTLYCTDIGKMIQSPIFHVNADNPESVIFATRLALDFRNKFKKDVFIDLFCYRRRGHNEVDDPSITQPVMYQKIKNHPTVCKIYADYLKTSGLLSNKKLEKITKLYRKSLESDEYIISKRYELNINNKNKSFKLLTPLNRSSEIERLQNIAKSISNIPANFKTQTVVAKIYSEREKMAIGIKPFDWGGAENLTYASIVDKGISVRLSGEDSSRGTFSHRHAVIYDQVNGSTYIPINNIHEKQGKFRILDSVLSEEAVLAFEYGYSVASTNTLTIWEAQFGDFANGAQVVIDQFISSGEQKWNQICNLVMFLPHGYEGQGPEHSSARLERYLQLCANNNIKICIPSTPAQFYHILYLQVICKKPLILMTPKSLLRHPKAVSSIKELAYGIFQPVLDDNYIVNKKSIRHIIFCSGKIYYDLSDKKYKDNRNDTAILRIEQLYPFPDKILNDLLKKYPNVHNYIWCQEEPLNQGAWYYIKPIFSNILPSQTSLRCVSRDLSSSSTIGHPDLHNKQQQDLVKNAFLY